MNLHWKRLCLATILASMSCSATAQQEHQGLQASETQESPSQGTDAPKSRGLVRVTPLVTGVEASFRGLAVRNEREAWVTGSNGVVIRTIDSGKNWNRVMVPDSEDLDFRDVELLGDGTVLLMSIGPGKSSRVIRSTDNGVRWTTVLTNSDPKGFFDGMAFRDDGRRGMLFGDPIDGRLDLYSTRDGGESWQRLPIEQRPKLNPGEYGFAASGSSIAIMDDQVFVVTGGSTARVIRSSDGGRNWAASETKIRSGDESTGIFSVDFLDDETAVVIGGDYLKPERDENNFAISRDTGKAWRNMPSVRMPHKACIKSLGNRRLLTCGRTGVAYSADSGQSWVTVTQEGYFTLAVDRESGTGFLAGKDGRVARVELSISDAE